MKTRDLILNPSEADEYAGAVDPHYSQLRTLAQRQAKTYECAIRVVREDGTLLESITVNDSSGDQ